MRRAPTTLAAALAALTLFVAACGGDDEPSSSGTPTATATEAADTGAITKNDANSAISLKIGSKNFTEQKVLGEIYAQGLAAAGYDTSTVDQDPDRIVPVDAMRVLEKAQRIKKLHDHYFVTTGTGAMPSKMAELGAGIADELVGAGVNAVILTAT